jgi:hypothetical protein
VYNALSVMPPLAVVNRTAPPRSLAPMLACMSIVSGRLFVRLYTQTVKRR